MTPGRSRTNASDGGRNDRCSGRFRTMGGSHGFDFLATLSDTDPGAITQADKR